MAKTNLNNNGLNKKTGFDDYDMDATIPVGKNDITIVAEVDSETDRHKVADFGHIAFDNNKILPLLSGNNAERDLAIAIIKSRKIREITVANNIVLLAGKRGGGKTTHNNAFITTCVSETDPDYKAEDELFDLLRFSPPVQVAELRKAVIKPHSVPGYFTYLEKALSSAVVYKKQKKGENEYYALTLDGGSDLFIAHAEIVKELLDALTAKNNNIKTLSEINNRVEGGLIIPTTLYTESRDGIYENSSFYTDVQIKGYGDAVDIVFSVNRLFSLVDNITEAEIQSIIDEIKTYTHTLKKSMLNKLMDDKERKEFDKSSSKLNDLFKVSVIVKNGFTAQIRISFYFPYESLLVVAGCNRSLKVVSFDENTPMGSYMDSSRDDKSSILKGGLSKIILYKPSTMSLLMNSICCTVVFELRDDGQNKELFLGINADVLYFEYDGYHTVVTAERFRSRFVTKNNLIANGSLFHSVFNTMHGTVMSTHFVNNIVNSSKFKTAKDKTEAITSATKMADKLVISTNAYMKHINFNPKIIDIIGAAMSSSSVTARQGIHKEIITIESSLVTDIVNTRRDLARKDIGMD